MEWYEWVIDVLGVLCTIASIISAVKSATYYKKSKNISQLCNNIVALNEMENLRNLLGELVGFSNSANIKGKQVVKIVSEIGNKMLSSVQCIEKNTDTNNWGKFCSFLYLRGSENQVCKFTKYATGNGGNSSCRWWLRTSGNYLGRAATVFGYLGGVDYTGSGVTISDHGVRPALWIDLSVL